MIEEGNLAPTQTDEEPTIPLTIQDENLDQAYGLSVGLYEAEDDRRKSTETKATLFMGSISIATTIVIAANALIWNATIPGLIVKLMVAMSFFISVYAMRTVRYSLKVLKRSSYSVLDFNDINRPANKFDYLRYLIKTYHEMTLSNSKVVNQKVTYLAMAQENYRRAIFVVSVYALVVLVYAIFFRV